MKEFKTTDGSVISIPEKISEITVEQLIKFSLIGEINNSIEDLAKILAVFTDVPVEKLPLGDFLEITSTLIVLLSTQPSQSPVTEFTLDGVKYIGRSAEELTTKEFIDFDTLSKDAVANLPTLLAIVFTEENERPGDYIKQVKERAAKFLKLDAETAQQALVFFSEEFLKYAEAMVGSLASTNPKMKEIMKKMNLLHPDGAGN